MNHAAYQRLVIGYHGCDAKVARNVLEKGGNLQSSENNYDWLGKGIYFWEHGPIRALEWAKAQKKRGRVETPAVVGALIQLGNCFDLLDVRFTALLEQAYTDMSGIMSKRPLLMPVNEPLRAGDTDNLLRKLDCAVVNWAMESLDEDPDLKPFQSVRGVFQEGSEAFPGSSIRRKSHIQIAVRDPACVIGLFSSILGSMSSARSSAFDPAKAWQKVRERLGKMSDEQKVQTLVNAGILTSGRKLAEPYRTGKLPSLMPVVKAPAKKKVASRKAGKVKKTA